MGLISDNDSAAVFWSGLGSALLRAAGGERGRSRASLLAEGLGQLPTMLQQSRRSQATQEMHAMQLAAAKTEQERAARWTDMLGNARRTQRNNILRVEGRPTPEGADRLSGASINGVPVDFLEAMGPDRGAAMLAAGNKPNYGRYKTVDGGLVDLGAEGGPRMLLESTKAPKTRSRNAGDISITEEWDGTKWVEVGRSPRWQESTKTAINFMTPAQEVVLSEDGGRTYVGPDGDPLPMPYGSIRLGTETGATEVRRAKAVKDAQAQINDAGLPSIARPPRDAARDMGTGPWSNLAATFDAVAGGLGVDAIVGSSGFFPETQNNRQVLRVLRQLGKSALMNSSRGAVWEQERIDELFPNPDKFWSNPVTEARKIDKAKEALELEKRYNNQMIASGGLSPKKIDELRSNNIEIGRLLALISDGNEASNPLGLRGNEASDPLGIR